MAQVSDYTGLITSEHAGKPNFTAMVSAVAGCFTNLTNTYNDIPANFDLDQAIGAQLDIVGQWVGLSRYVNVPLPNVYFSFDTTGLGFDQGSWRGPFDPTQGLTKLDDTTYRTMLRAKIGANRWDSTLGSFQTIMSGVFAAYGSTCFATDNQDMTMTVNILGPTPPAVIIALLKGGYLALKPEGVHITGYSVPSIPSAPFFGFDVTNSTVSGFDTGAWATPL